MSIAYCREIDGLRAIAVTAVVLYHAGVGPPAGFVGVDIFFVISGYLITALLLREHASTGQINLPDFYSRRVRRILPAFSLVVLSTLAASAVLLSPGAFARLADSAIAAVAFVGNFHFQSVTGGYFDTSSAEMPLLHLWSLSVEEQFYLVWPALLIVLLRLRVRLVPVLAGLALASFGLAEWMMRSELETAFYQTLARFWELAAGGLIASMPARRFPAGTAWVALAITIGACSVPIARFPGVGALPAVLGASLLVASLHAGATNPLLASRLMVGVGRISYSLYLWHWPLLALYHATMTGEGSTSVRLQLVATAVLLAIATYRYVEQPLRRPTAMRGVLTLAAVSLLALTAFMFVGPRKPSASELAAGDMPPRHLECNYGTMDTVFPRVGCESIPGQPAQVALWGDSFALAWQPVAVEIAARAKVSAIDYSRDDCRPALGYVEQEQGEADLRCRDWNSQVLASVRGMDTVILAGRWQRAMLPERRARFPEALDRTLTALQGVRRVIVIGPSPELPDSAPKCLQTDDWSACRMRRSDFEAQTRDARSMLQELVARHPNVEYVDPAPWLCSAQWCEGRHGDMVLYWDSKHVSTTAARAFAEQLPTRAPNPAAKTLAR